MPKKKESGPSPAERLGSELKAVIDRYYQWPETVGLSERAALEPVVESLDLLSSGYQMRLDELSEDDD